MERRTQHTVAIGHITVSLDCDSVKQRHSMRRKSQKFCMPKMRQSLSLMSTFQMKGNVIEKQGVESIREKRNNNLSWTPKARRRPKISCTTDNRINLCKVHLIPLDLYPLIFGLRRQHYTQIPVSTCHKCKLRIENTFLKSQQEYSCIKVLNFYRGIETN